MEGSGSSDLNKCGERLRDGSNEVTVKRRTNA